MATYLTKEGLAKLEKELEELKSQKRRLSKEVGVAREFGDLRENAEYHAAKERLQQVLQKTGELEYKLSNVQVVDPKELPEGLATLGARIKVKDLSGDREESYSLVGPEESDPASGKISFQSPLGKAFLGRHVGDQVNAQLPGGTRSYKILSIQPME